MIKKISELTKEDLASICDHTFLKRPECYKPTAEMSSADLWGDALFSFLDESINIKPYSICLRPEVVSLAKQNYSLFLPKVASVVGFPNPQDYSQEWIKSEICHAVDDGAEEIDMVLDYYRFLSGGDRQVRYNLKKIQEVIESKGNIKSKLILETSELLPIQIKRACNLATKCGVDFVKTSTGFGKYGAKVGDLKIMRENFNGGVKISGGVNIENVYELLEAASGRTDGQIDLDPMKIRIGESSLLKNLYFPERAKSKSY